VLAQVPHQVRIELACGPRRPEFVVLHWSAAHREGLDHAEVEVGVAASPGRRVAYLGQLVRFQRVQASSTIVPGQTRRPGSARVMLNHGLRRLPGHGLPGGGHRPSARVPNTRRGVSTYSATPKRSSADWITSPRSFAHSPSDSCAMPACRPGCTSSTSAVARAM
jgi:hypothetical protein